MSYTRNLTFHLRVQGLSEAEIAETLEEVLAHEAASGTPAEDEFGTAEAYSKQFPKQKRRTRGSTMIIIGFVLSVAYVVFAILLWTLGKTDIREFVGPMRLLPAVALVMAGVLAGFLTDYFQPAQKSNPAR